MITALSNQRIKNIHQLMSQSRARREQGLFVTEGVKMFLEAPSESIQEVFVSEAFLEKYGSVDAGRYSPESTSAACLDKLQACDYEVVTAAVMKKISDIQTPQGILCVLRQRQYRLPELLQVKNPFFLLLEDIQDPGNLGTIFRTAEGAGVDGVILSRGCVDIYNPKTIRSTMGSVYRMPFVYSEDLVGVIHCLRQAGVQIAAAHLREAKCYDREDYRGGIAFLIGNEGKGLKDTTVSAADTCIRIPMEGQVESLNAAVAASILMYEAARQRRI